jgi:hypothetical protein
MKKRKKREKRREKKKKRVSSERGKERMIIQMDGNRDLL